MAFWNKKKNDDAVEVQNSAADEEVKQEKSTLDIIKESMGEVEEEIKAEREQSIAEASTQSPAPETNNMPTPEEIRKAQEILARAQAAQAASGTKVGVNAPVNTSNLKACINLFRQAQSQENLKKVMDCLQNPQTLVCVPAQIITSKENEEKMKQGGEVKLEGPIKINPVILTDNQGKKVFPVFSGEDSIPEQLRKSTPKVNMPFAHCLNIMKGIKDVDTFALDPYTANIRIGVNIQEKPNEPKKA